MCIDIAEATDLASAFSPENFTTSTATVFHDFDCNGDIFTVVNPGAKRGPLLRFRSVVFS
ncbi:hypothetical protein [Streptomyces erythrochromogenes]|uniref:hypothetical protein n=1 Tax=Streptomyces erythrochromogenes TaxID=285574 RepID=UPI00381EDEF1